MRGVSQSKGGSSDQAFIAHDDEDNELEVFGWRRGTNTPKQVMCVYSRSTSVSLVIIEKFVFGSQNKVRAFFHNFGNSEGISNVMPGFFGFFNGEENGQTKPKQSMQK